MSNQLNLRVIIALLFPACCYGLSLAGARPEVVLFHCFLGAMFGPWVIVAKDITKKPTKEQQMKLKDLDHY